MKYQPARITLSFILSLGTAFVIAAMAGCQPAAEESPAGAPAIATGTAEDAGVPDFTLPTLAGDTLRMADYKGKVVLLNFWATWCAPCRQEIPDLIELYDELGPADFAVIGISLDETDPAYVQEFASDMEIDYPIALDQMGAVAELFGGVYALPTTYVLDRQGEIVHRTIGLFPTAAMREELASLIVAD